MVFDVPHGVCCLLYTLAVPASSRRNSRRPLSLYVAVVPVSFWCNPKGPYRLMQSIAPVWVCLRPWGQFGFDVPLGVRSVGIWTWRPFRLATQGVGFLV